MLVFSNLSKRMSLEEYLDGSLCTLYVSPSDPQEPEYLVRHFDQQLGPNDVQPFVDIIAEVGKWVDERSELSSMVRIEAPIEVGNDYIIRRFHTYTTPVYAYQEWEIPPRAPMELERMYSILANLTGNPKNIKEEVTERVLTNSLVGSETGKTYFHDYARCFIVVEPRITLEDIREWNSL